MYNLQGLLGVIRVLVRVPVLFTGSSTLQSTWKIHKKIQQSMKISLKKYIFLQTC
jgi:hypothetical protein